MAKAIEVTQTQENGYTVYKFCANNTDYDVLTQDGKEFTVYSSRRGCAAFPGIKVYASLEEMAQRSKALANLAALIAA